MKPGAAGTGKTVFFQVDIDSLWAVRRGYGLEPERPEELQEDAVWEEAIPRFLDLFAEFGAPATFFVIGRDAVIPSRRRRLCEIAAAGHEIANHSYSHRLDLAAASEAEIGEDIARAQQAIGEAVGRAPVGFRCPGYGVSGAVARAVRQSGLIYDSSVLPSPWGFAMRAVARGLSRKETVGPAQYGSIRCARAPARPYVPSAADFCRPERYGAADGPRLVEIPVSVAPFLRLPFHAGVSLALGKTYFRACFGLHRRLNSTLNFVLHGVDLLDTREHRVTARRAGRFFFDLSFELKAARVRSMIGAICQSHRAVRSGDWAGEVQKTVDLPV